MTVQHLIMATLAALLFMPLAHAEHCARFSYNEEVLHGRVSGNRIHIITGSLFPMGPKPIKQFLSTTSNGCHPQSHRKCLLLG